MKELLGKPAQGPPGALAALGGLPLLGRQSEFIRKTGPGAPGRPGGRGWSPANKPPLRNYEENEARPRWAPPWGVLGGLPLLGR